MPNLDLSRYGITDVEEIVHNPSYDLLFKEETRDDLQGYEKGTVTDLGAVAVIQEYLPDVPPKTNTLFATTQLAIPFGGLTRARTTTSHCRLKPGMN